MTKSTISEELTITGNIVGTGTIDVRGIVLGDIEADAIDILAGGRVEGHVRVRSAEIRGHLKGAVTAQSLGLHGQAEVEADVTAETMSAERGAQVRGRVDIGGATRAKAAEQAAGAQPADPLAQQVRDVPPSAAFRG